MNLDRDTLLLGLIVVMVIVAVLAFASGEGLLAGVLFLGVSLAIFFRERET